MTEVSLLTDEAALLGACLMSEKAIWVAVDAGITPQDFEYARHQEIYRALLGLANEGIRVDPVLLSERLGAYTDQDPGVKSHLFALPGCCTTTANAREYAAAVVESSIERQARNAVDEIISGSLRGSALVEALQEAVYRVQRPAKEGRYLSEAVAELYGEFDTPMRGLDYPWSDIQQATKGLMPGWLCILAGEPGHGKSALALDISQHLIDQGKRVLYLSLEMSPRDIAVRMAQRLDVSSSIFFGGRPTDQAREKILSLAEQQTARLLRIEMADQISTFGILVRRYKPDLLVLDHLHLLPWGKANSEYAALTKHSRELKLLARRYDIPVLCLAQLNRQKERNTMPTLERLRGSGSIEQDADSVLFCWRKRDENDELTGEGALRVSKARFGWTGTCRMTFNGENQRVDVHSKAQW